MFPCFRDSVGRHEDMPERFVLVLYKPMPFYGKVCTDVG